MNHYFLEFLGTLFLILIGEGVNAAASLEKCKAKGAGWVFITLGWGLAVMVGALVSSPSGAHLNPAVTLGLAMTGQFAWAEVPGYIVSQMIGGFSGAVLVWLFYRDHFAATADHDTKLGVFCTAPAIAHKWNNLFSEIVATFVLIFCVFCIPVNFGGETGLIPITYVIIAIGMGLGSTTGYALNAARDIAPRFAHTILPIPNKGSSHWEYAWIPLCGPIIGAALAALLWNVMA